MIDTIPIPQLAFAVAAVLATVVLFMLPRAYLGPQASLLNPVRRALLPPLDAVLSKHGGYAETTVSEASYAGTYIGSLADLETALWEAGYTRYPLASLAETDDGRTETSSWARHERPWSKRQVHVRVFDAHPDVGATDQAAFDVYAHYEYTAHHPMVAHRHYNGLGLKPTEGVKKARAHLEAQGVTLVDEEGGNQFEPPLRGGA